MIKINGDNYTQTTNYNEQAHSFNDEPAIIITKGKYKGDKHWYKNGQIHRENGAAIIFNDGRKFYYLHGVEYLNIKSDDEWIIKQIIE